MAEAGVDIAHYESKTVHVMPNQDWDVVVTVCGHALETCPVFPGKAKIIHVGFDDPPAKTMRCFTTDGCETRFATLPRPFLLPWKSSLHRTNIALDRQPPYDKY